MLPLLETPGSVFAADGTLRNTVVVQLQIVQQSRFQVDATVEAGLLHQFIDASVETLDYAVRLPFADAVVTSGNSQQVKRRR